MQVCHYVHTCWVIQGLVKYLIVGKLPKRDIYAIYAICIYIICCITHLFFYLIHKYLSNTHSDLFLWKMILIIIKKTYGLRGLGGEVRHS